MDPKTIDDLAAALEGKEPQDILRAAYECYGDGLTLACSFGAEDVALVAMTTELKRPVDIFYLDTDLLFRETYQTRDRLAERYDIRFRRIPPSLSLSAQTQQHGPMLWSRDPDLCCHLRKVLPLQGALQGYAAWATGIRREQSPARAGAAVVEWDTRFGLVKFNPLAAWRWDQVWAYIRRHEVPYNPLHDQGYPSIGCFPCTRAVRPDEDLRSGRWSGFMKTECGLHAGGRSRE